MSDLQINTTQNVKIKFVASNIGERLAAFFIDFSIIIIYYAVVFVNFIGFNDLDQWSVIALKSLALLPIFFYSLIQEIIMNGQTIGKRLLKLKVVKIDGYQTSISDYLIRWIFRIPDIYVFGIGFFVLAFNKKNQRLGDIAAGTSIISLKSKASLKNTILEHLKSDYKPSFPQVIKLSDNDARIIKSTFLKAAKSNDFKTLIKLRTKIIEVTGIKNKTFNNDKYFIDTVLKDYNYYTQNM